VFVIVKRTIILAGIFAFFGLFTNTLNAQEEEKAASAASLYNDGLAKLKAKELYMKEVKPNFFHFYVKPAYKFFYKYIVRLGILDGKKGFTICYLNAYINKSKR